MSPEQVLSSKNLDFRADLWVLSAVIYHCITGGPPFAGETLGALFQAITSRKYRPPSELVDKQEPELDGWFERAFHEDPDARFGSARELSTTFSELVGKIRLAESWNAHSVSGDELTASLPKRLGTDTPATLPFGPRPEPKVAKHISDGTIPLAGPHRPSTGDGTDTDDVKRADKLAPTAVLQYDHSGPAAPASVPTAAATGSLGTLAAASSTLDPAGVPSGRWRGAIGAVAVVGLLVAGAAALLASGAADEPGASTATQSQSAVAATPDTTDNASTTTALPSSAGVSGVATTSASGSASASASGPASASAVAANKPGKAKWPTAGKRKPPSSPPTAKTGADVPFLMEKK